MSGRRGLAAAAVLALATACGGGEAPASPTVAAAAGGGDVGTDSSWTATDEQHEAKRFQNRVDVDRVAAG